MRLHDPTMLTMGFGLDSTYQVYKEYAAFIGTYHM